MKVKICGITTLDDALAAIDAGADLLGFNFYPNSPRYIEPAACATLANHLRGRGEQVTLVGVFVNAAPEAVTACLDVCNLDYAQLHGDEPPEDLAALQPWAFKAIRPTSTEEAKRQALRYLPAAPDGYNTLVADPPRPAFLLDAAAGQFGGSGQVADWDMARVLARRWPLLLAGGLRPDNVAAAITAVRPWGVDVASGVESSPGRKDAAKMRAFVEAARGDALARRHVGTLARWHVGWADV
jgi:phosphoribosylanthranilate isomerase